jgi:cytochrome c oxidase subunit 2
MSKFVAVTLVLITIASAIPILAHNWQPPPDISTHGHLIDEQLSNTMWEAGLCFIAAQLVLAVFIWMFSDRKPGARIQPGTRIKIKTFPGGARTMVIASFLLVGTEVFALGLFGTKAWANIYFTPAATDSIPIQVQAGQFAFYFRYPGPDGKFGPLHPEMISETNQNFFGLDVDHDPASKDDSVTAEMAIPVNKEIHLLLHAKDVGHSFYVRELRIQQDFVPGLDLSLHFTATKIGRYEIVCTQLCGAGHFNMKAYLDVLSQADYDDWLKKEAALQ